MTTEQMDWLDGERDRAQVTEAQRRPLVGNSVTVPEMIGPTMKRRLQSAGQRAVDAVEARNVAIEEAHAAGATLREIGEAVGLSHVAVMKIIRRR